MITVPKSNVVPLRRQSQVDPTYLAIAAAELHRQGKLFEPQPPEPKPDGDNDR